MLRASEWSDAYCLRSVTFCSTYGRARTMQARMMSETERPESDASCLIFSAISCGTRDFKIGFMLRGYHKCGTLSRALLVWHTKLGTLEGDPNCVTVTCCPNVDNCHANSFGTAKGLGATCPLPPCRGSAFWQPTCWGSNFSSKLNPLLSSAWRRPSLALRVLGEQVDYQSLRESLQEGDPPLLQVNALLTRIESACRG